ncbi:MULTISPECIES: SDR family NAD(P)-dependent oxidoreductase [unclassified Bradyrhizobium]|uniref:SDR family NAD(P)-dependent oxidoreductase n=1 Tax=unclassified Bradyrhizobium TaxID=2631580 RepID=UPI002304F684|nr:MULTISPECIES: SDR family NAD(P)-dependent oxidoreductase [unclassified Bradyrhizobium]MDA9451198.1 short-chain dehydrogenase [Bradyrhizobium sp. CCBAU 21360]MDA9457577.1 short-chain dehydrogenase [Bradyrhizobium sp. CCBAU 21359]
MNDKPVAFVSGVGPGTGAAIVRRFSREGFRVFAAARSTAIISGLENELENVHAVVCDVSESAEVTKIARGVIASYGVPQVLVHNAVGGAFGNFLTIEPIILERNFRTNVLGLLHLSREFAPGMIERGTGTILVTGNTSSIRGKANFAGFAPTKAAQRVLAESIARECGPKGLHVAYVLIDAVIDVPWARERYPERPDSFFIDPAAIADELWHLHSQPRSAWSFLTELRPFGEKW